LPTPDEFRGPRATRLIAVLSALFFLSGTSALIYQVLWLRLLGLVFGVTVYAASTVWAVFMAGLAVGSILGGRAADRVRRPLVWLGLAEALIGVTALATPPVLDLLQRIYAGLHSSASGSPALLIAVRLAMSFAVLIVPSSLMGATLPLVVKSSLFGAEGLGPRVGVLYATNTAGAIAGSLCAGLVFIPRAGIQASFLIAAGLNFVVAIAAVVIGRRLPESAGRGRAVPAAPKPAPPIDRPQAVVLAVFAISGFVSLGLEVVWFRILTLFLRPTVYGYSMMLAAVLAGIAAGGYLAAPWLRRRAGRDWLLPLAWLEGAIAIAALLSFATLPAIPRLMAAAGPAVASVVGDYLAYQAIVSFAVIMPAMLLSGIAFPIGLQLWTGPLRDHQDDVATRVGLFYSLNVTGAILGSLAAGFVLLPRIGSLATLWLLAALSLASAMALLVVARRARATLASAAALATTFAGAVAITPDPFDAFLAQRYPGQTIVWQREAVQATVSVHQERSGVHTLHVSGNHQASGRSPFVHQRIGNLPMAVHPEAREALVIGLGGGATPGALSQHAGVNVDVVELSPEVAQAAGRFFTGINFDVLRKPNVTLHIDDGRNYLLLTEKRYDVITADVILPIHAGSGNLYSAEYFELARGRLKPGGIVVQWVAGTEAEYKTIARTFLSVFPETTLWADGSLMLGSVEPLRLRKQDFDWKLEAPGRREMIAALGLESFDDLLRLYVAGPSELRDYVGDGPILTDDRPLVEYFLSLPRDRSPDLGVLKGDVMRHVVDLP
jgi:spermidine synthase